MSGLGNHKTSYGGVKTGQLQIDRGSAVIGAALNLALLTLLALSLAGITFLGYQTMVLRDIAVSSSRFGALVDVSPGETERYALKLMQQGLPLLASQVEVDGDETLVAVRLSASVAGLALLPTQLQLESRAQARRETLG